MYTKTSDFLAEWKQETAVTQRLLDSLTDESLKQEVAPGYRTLGQLAWHLVWSLSYLKDLGLHVSKPEGKKRHPNRPLSSQASTAVSLMNSSTR
ncbi:DinB family protein [Brevibacillus ruminantium]|uniref:DinB family protein n=1 Tax=Brevibacillus ruminantium TaxID=2950604 RepID=A0ABY4WG55_9BACL|nr:DinB family protein [Brevibacillus ruminantium]USG66140.1 DinB family protein [Brevibacillus ruminantium]